MHLLYLLYLLLHSFLSLGRPDSLIGGGTLQKGVISASNALFAGNTEGNIVFALDVKQPGDVLGRVNVLHTLPSPNAVSPIHGRHAGR